ncbi:MAG: hypothetical protein J5962_00790 [Lachnospiraceae bacterium]|nr:hypothetical protein [Lachnospiraceae bacterium]
MREINTPIIDGLEKYLNSEHIPWHMPGHKRRVDVKRAGDAPGQHLDVIEAISNVRRVDVTEVPGLDDLHCPEEMIRESQEQLRRIYGTYKSYYLINGSTCGIMAAIAACGRTGIIVADNCHKSVINTVNLLDFPVAYARTTRALKLPDIHGERDADGAGLPDIRGVVTAEVLEAVCREHRDYGAVIITSPTYEGVVSDISALKKITEKYGMKLIVDEAHGAHLPFLCPELSAIRQGADVVIQSLHKTMEALTQTALLHITNTCEEADDIKRYLSFFMSSSPSYILLSSLELAVARAEEKRLSDGFVEYREALEGFLSKCLNLENLKIVNGSALNKLNAYGYDKTRIVVYSKSLLPGKIIEDFLYEEGHIVSEMSGLNYVVLISTYMDEEADFYKLYDTLCRVDKKISNKNVVSKKLLSHGVDSNKREQDLKYLNSLIIGEVAVRNLYIYPPGIPIIRMGEKITKEAVEELTKLVNSGKYIRNM